MAAKSRDILRREKMDITLPALIDLLITTKQAEGKSTKTLRWNQNNLERFADHLGTGAAVRLSEVTIDDAREFVSWLPAGATKRIADHVPPPNCKLSYCVEVLIRDRGNGQARQLSSLLKGSATDRHAAVMKR